MFRPADEPAPPGWETVSARPTAQTVAEAPPDGADDADAEAPVRPLGPDDAAHMLALAEAAKPGPFGPRSLVLGGMNAWTSKAPWNGCTT